MDKTVAMFSLVEEYQASNISMREFSAAKGIKLCTFTYWVRKKKRLESAAATGNFIPLNFTRFDGGSRTLEIVYPNGVRIITGNTDISQLHRLIKLF